MAIALPSPAARSEASLERERVDARQRGRVRAATELWAALTRPAFATLSPVDLSRKGGRGEEEGGAACYSAGTYLPFFTVSKIRERSSTPLRSLAVKL